LMEAGWLPGFIFTGWWPMRRLRSKKCYWFD